MMKILWFSNTPAAGEACLNAESVRGGWLKALDKGLQDKIELHIVFHYPKPKEPFKCGNSYYYPISKGNFYWNLVKNFLWPKEDKEDYRSLYVQYVERIKPDLIHIHGTENPYIGLLSKIDVPVVVSIQGNMTVYHHKYLAGLEWRYMKTLNSWRPLRGLLRGLRPFYRSYKEFERKRQFEQLHLARCEYIIGRTEWDRRITRVLAPNREYFTGEEILRDVFYEKQWAAPGNDTVRIHTTCGDSFFKGFETVCQAVHLLNRLGVKFEWRVAGIEETDLIVRVVKKKLKTEYPQKNLVLMGRLTESQLVEAMLSAAVYVMPSHIENSPNSVCEAMILGMPCIATLAGGSGSLLKDGREGILIQDGDPWVMAGAIIELMSDYDRAVEYGRKARERALVRHSRERVIAEYLGIYQTIIERKPGAGERLEIPDRHGRRFLAGSV